MKILELLTSDYLVITGDDRETSPEEFIEIEDDLHLVKESSMEKDQTFQTLSMTLIDKVFQYFPKTSLNWL